MSEVFYGPNYENYVKEHDLNQAIFNLFARHPGSISYPMPNKSYQEMIAGDDWGRNWIIGSLERALGTTNRLAELKQQSRELTIFSPNKLGSLAVARYVKRPLTKKYYLATDELVKNTDDKVGYLFVAFNQYANFIKPRQAGDVPIIEEAFSQEVELFRNHFIKG